MADGINIVISDNINAGIARKILAIGAAADKSETSLDRLRAALAQFSSIDVFSRAASSASNLVNEIKSATSASNELTRVVRGNADAFDDAAENAERFAETVRQLDGVTIDFERTTNRLGQSLQSLVGYVAAAFSVRALVQASDAYTTIQNKISTTTTTAEELADVQERLYDLALRTRSSVEATTDGYVRFYKALQITGASSTEVLRFTETLNKTLITAGRSTAEVSAIVTQLGQALTSGKLQGDEFRSLSENLPVEALQAVADVLGVSREELKGLSTEGKITAGVLREAFANMAEGADAAFAKTIPTIEQALTNLNTKFIDFMGGQQWAAIALAGAIGLIGDNLNILIPIIALLAAAWVAVQLSQLYQEIKLLIVGIQTWAAAQTYLNTQLIPAILLMAEFTLALLAGIAVLYVIAATIAQVTGTTEEFNQWTIDAADSVAKLTKSLFSLIPGMGGVDDTATTTTTSTSALDQKIRELTQSSNSASSAQRELATATVETTQAQGAQISRIVQQIDKFDQLTAAIHATWAAQKQLNAEVNKSNSAGYAQARANGGTFSQGSFTYVDQSASDLKDTITTLDPPAYKNGGSFKVKGKAGADRNIVPIKASKGERVDVTTAAQQRENAANENATGRSGVVVNMQVVTPDANSFRRSRGQLAADLGGAINASNF